MNENLEDAIRSRSWAFIEVPLDTGIDLAFKAAEVGEGPAAPAEVRTSCYNWTGWSNWTSWTSWTSWSSCTPAKQSADFSE
jgi:hypothetical protein